MRARLLPLAAALVAFGASLGSGFHFDDYAIFSDPVFRSKLGLLELWRLPQAQPLTRLTYWLNYEVGGADPLGYHLLNLALHIGAVLLAYECLRRLLPGRAAVIAAALFAVHPMQAEAVNYVWARGAVLAALLCFASLMAWTGGRRGIALGWFAAALLADPGCAAFPLVPLLIEARKANLRQVWRYGVGMLTLAAAGLAHASLLPGGGGSWWRYFLAQGIAIPRYLRLLVAPLGFTVDPDITTPAAWLGLLAWAGIAAAAVLLWRIKKEWALWLFMGVILLLPASLLPSPDLAADRRMYLAMFAFAAAAGLLLERVKQPAVAAALVVVLAGLGAARTRVWMSDARLWREAVRRAPGKVRPKIQLARAVPAAEALELLGDAARLAPNDPDVAAETGRVFLKEQQFEAAVEEFGRALALDPYSAVNYNDRGVALDQMGQTAAARMDFQRALELDPGLREARENLARITGAR
jgi:tetratricopeptide (TPR) repeat protein